MKKQIQNKIARLVKEEKEMMKLYKRNKDFGALEYAGMIEATINFYRAKLED